MNTHTSRKDRDAKGARKRGSVASTYTTTTSNPTGFGYTNDYASNFPYGPPYAQDDPSPFELYLHGTRSTSTNTTHRSGSASHHHHHHNDNNSNNYSSRNEQYEEWLRQNNAKELASSGLSGSSGMNPHPHPSSTSSARSGGQRDNPYPYFTPPSSMPVRVAPHSHSQAHGYYFDNGYAPYHDGTLPHAYDGGPWPGSSMHVHMPPEMEMVESQMDVDTQEAQDVGMMSPFEYMMHQLHQMKTVKTKQCDTSRLGAMSVGPSGTGSANANASGNEDFETEWNVPRDVSPLILPARFPGLSRKSRRDRDY